MNREEILKHFNITKEEIENDCHDLEDDNFENWEMNNWQYVEMVSFDSNDLSKCHTRSSIKLISPVCGFLC